MDGWKNGKMEGEKVDVNTNDHLPLKTTYSFKKKNNTLVLC